MAKTKQWKKNGDQDKFIVKLIKQGKVTKFTKPASLRTDYPHVFAEFSQNVIRNHLNLLKMSNGLHLDGTVEEDEDDDNVEDDQGNGAVTDLCFDDAPSTPCVTNMHHNYPVLCDMYKDPENQFEKVVMAVLLPSGIQNIRVEVSEDGLAALVKYGWPKTMYNMEDLFKKPIETQQINMFHPKVLCFKNSLEKVRKRVDACPESVIKVNLPIKVQTAMDSWMKGGIKRDDGTNIAFAEFKGYIKEYNKKINDSQLVFDM